MYGDQKNEIKPLLVNFLIIWQANRNPNPKPFRQAAAVAPAGQPPTIFFVIIIVLAKF